MKWSIIPYFTNAVLLVFSTIKLVRRPSGVSISLARKTTKNELPRNSSLVSYSMCAKTTPTFHYGPKNSLAKAGVALVLLTALAL